MSKTKNSFKWLVILLLTFIIFKLTFMLYIVNGESMSPTLEHGEIGLGISHTIHDISRFDVVVVKAEDKYLIKRVIGLPGEKIQYINNELYIDNEKVEDVYATGNTEDFAAIVKDGEYFCLGDNREHSSDSRVYGSFDTQEIVAISIFK